MRKQVIKIKAKKESETLNSKSDSFSLGIRKINIATASFDMLAKCAKQYLENNEKPNYFDLSQAMVDGVYKNVKRHIEVFNNK